MTENVFYEATVTSSIPNYGEKLYFGITEPPFKSRFNNHTKSFRNKKYSTETELSKEIWRIKERNADYNVHWKIRKLCPTYNATTKKCMLCLNEKKDILYYDGGNLLNKRSEIISTCRHRYKHSLSACDVK